MHVSKPDSNSINVPLKFLLLIICGFVFILQACVTMSEGEKTRLLLENLAKESKACCTEKVYVGANIILNEANELEIASVVGGSSLDKAGIMPGDIILKMDNVEIKNRYQAFKIYDHKYPGDEISLTVRRKGEIINKQMKLESLHVLNVSYKLIELVYKDVPVRLAIIPGEQNFDNLGYKQEYEKVENYMLGSLEGSFIKNFQGHKNFLIVDRQKTKSILDELKFQESGLVDNKSRLKLGDMLGATHLMAIDSSSYTAEDNKPVFLMTFRLVEIESGRNIATSPLKIKGKKSVDIVQRDLLDYMNNKLKKIGYLEKDSMAKYNSIRSNLSKQESLDILTNEIIPMYGKFLDELQMIHPNTDEVNTIHKLYISSVALQYEGLKDLETSIIQKNTIQFREANIKIKEGVEKIKQFKDERKILCDKHKVTLNN